MNRTVNLEQATTENLHYLVNEIKKSLKLVNSAIISEDDFQLQNYEDLRDIYHMIQKKESRLTMMEIEGVLEELRELKQINKKK
nr:DUF1128 family protein [Polycladospora coralii]